MSADAEGAGTSVCHRGSIGESHIARLFKFAAPMCSVCSRVGMGMPCDSCNQLLGS